MSTLKLLEPIADDMQALDSLILDNLRSDVLVIEQLGRHIVGGGGKRLRPALVFLAGRALNKDVSAESLTKLAAVVEFIHTATLLHDDVVDNSSLRRGRITANALWGNAASVLTGDFLYTRAFQLMVELDNMQILRIMADTTNRIAEGEVMQLMLSHKADISEETHMEVNQRKTAVLFSAAIECACLLSGAQTVQARDLAGYGLELGLAFQLADDCLDYTANAVELGKEPGDDLAEGKYTLPLIHALRECDDDTRKRVVERISSSGREAWSEVQKLIAETGGITYTSRRAEEAATRAAHIAADFPPGPAREALIQLAHYASQRDH